MESSLFNQPFFPEMIPFAVSSIASLGTADVRLFYWWDAVLPPSQQSLT